MEAMNNSHMQVFLNQYRIDVMSIVLCQHSDLPKYCYGEITFAATQRNQEIAEEIVSNLSTFRDTTNIGYYFRRGECDILMHKCAQLESIDLNLTTGEYTMNFNKRIVL